MTLERVFVAHRRRRTLFRISIFVALIMVGAFGAGCVRFSGGTWYVRSAPTPEGWPDLTPVNEVEVRTYPACRAAIVATEVAADDAERSMFMELFQHIRKNDIAMTAPVAIGYEDDSSDARMDSMAFLYRTSDLGPTGSDGAVSVRDIEPRTFASVGIRGAYNARNFTRGLGVLSDWLAADPTWRATGEPRYLGYNGPFVPWFMRYGEVQIPVEQASDLE